MATNMAPTLLRRQLAELSRSPVESFSAGLIDDNILKWRIVIIGPQDTLYENAVLVAHLIFPDEYPNKPPEMQFKTPMWHPNIYKDDGRVCISILHPPEEDQYGYEDAGERWMPVHSVESIVLSVISLLISDEPNVDSPANVDAAKQIREDPKAYKRDVRRLLRDNAEKQFE
ncbi:ubiquitin-conjugating enzyme/RWD-like protein [Phellopilus nigrolimitatus]|nr:ubiquitin-conjugating enzyme/RWD-like protein [Phellopilus nigrolimitatus]